MLKIKNHQNGDITVLTITGKIGDGSYTFFNKIRDLVNSKKRTIVLDLKGVNQLDEEDFIVLAGATRVIAAKCGQIKALVGPNTKSICRHSLESFFETYANESDLWQSFSLQNHL